MSPDTHKILGIINITEDSFYPASRTQADGAALRAAQILSEGAHILDIGAASSRPGARLIGWREEWKRLEPALRLIRGAFPDASISIDTYNSLVVKKVYDEFGPFIVNDISAGALDKEMLDTVGRLSLTYIAMHMRGTPTTMMALDSYSDVVEAVKGYFMEFSIKAADKGIENWVLDPGFGFAKNIGQNYELLSRLEEFSIFGKPVLVGLSRKSMAWKLLDVTPAETLAATQVLHFKALEGGASWLRVHDVKETVQTIKLYSAMKTSSPGAAKR